MAALLILALACIGVGFVALVVGLATDSDDLGLVALCVLPVGAVLLFVSAVAGTIERDNKFDDAKKRAQQSCGVYKTDTWRGKDNKSLFYRCANGEIKRMEVR